MGRLCVANTARSCLRTVSGLRAVAKAQSRESLLVALNASGTGTPSSSIRRYLSLYGVQIGCLRLS